MERNIGHCGLIAVMQESVLIRFIHFMFSFHSYFKIQNHFKTAGWAIEPYFTYFKRLRPNRLVETFELCLYMYKIL